MKTVKHSKRLVLDGLMGYEAQIAGVVDAAPKQFFKNLIVRLLKNISLKQIKEKRIQIFAKMKEENIDVRFINGGGTGSLHHTSKEASVTEVTVGSGFFRSEERRVGKECKYRWT